MQSLIHTLLLPGYGHPEELALSLYATSGMSEEKLYTQDTFAGRGRRSWSWSSYGRLALHDVRARLDEAAPGQAGLAAAPRELHAHLDGVCGPSGFSSAGCARCVRPERAGGWERAWAVDISAL